MKKIINNTDEFVQFLKQIDEYNNFEVYVVNRDDVMMTKDELKYVYRVIFFDKDDYRHILECPIDNKHMSFRRLINFLIKHKKIKYPIDISYIVYNELF